MTVVGASLLRATFAAGTGKTVWDVASRSLSFAMSVLVARELGASGFGTFAVYWYTAWMLSQATDLGLHLVSLRALATGESPSVFWSAIAAKGILTAGVILVVAAVVAAGSFSTHLLGYFVTPVLAGSAHRVSPQQPGRFLPRVTAAVVRRRHAPSSCDSGSAGHRDPGR